MKKWQLISLFSFTSVFGISMMISTIVLSRRLSSRPKVLKYYEVLNAPDWQESSTVGPNELKWNITDVQISINPDAIFSSQKCWYWIYIQCVEDPGVPGGYDYVGYGDTSFTNNAPAAGYFLSNTGLCLTPIDFQNDSTKIYTWDK